MDSHNWLETTAQDFDDFIIKLTIERRHATSRIQFVTLEATASPKKKRGRSSKRSAKQVQTDSTQESPVEVLAGVTTIDELVVLPKTCPTTPELQVTKDENYRMSKDDVEDQTDERKSVQPSPTLNDENNKSSVLPRHCNTNDNTNNVNVSLPTEVRGVEAESNKSDENTT